MTKSIFSHLALILALVSAGLAQDVTFSKTRFSSVKKPGEADVILTITDSNILIKGKKEKGIDLEIPYSSIDAMSYERSARHRVGEGAALMGMSLGAGAILMATKTASYWLDVNYHEGDDRETAVLRLDKSEYENVLAALNTKSGKQVTVVDAKASSINPTEGSKDVDEMIPYGMEQIMAALKPAMENEGCKVTDSKPDRVECKRSRGNNELTGGGGESVTAELKAEGGQTRVRISTGKGMLGRLAKKNWSTPIYQEMMKNLQGT